MYRTKYINGIAYSEKYFRQSKTDAQRIAEQYRAKGISARVTKNSTCTGYTVWTPFETVVEERMKEKHTAKMKANGKKPKK